MNVTINTTDEGGLDFAGSSEWNDWQTETIDVILSAGANAIRLTATGSGGAPNMDKMDITIYQGDVVTPTPTPTPTPDPTPTPTSDPNDTPGPTAPPNSGFISITDPAPGWASVNGETTGGGTDLSGAITVSTMSELENAVSGTHSKIILVEPGIYTGTLSPDANTTVIGLRPGVTIWGSIQISGEDKTNIIVRNMAVRQDRCDSYEECRSGGDAVYIGRSAHHVWLDHLDIADGQDGNCDITRQGDFITVSWTKFHYTYEKEHAFSNLIASSGGETESRGKLQIPYMCCWWGANVVGRQPMGRFGKIHMLNNYHKNNPNDIHEINTELSLIAERCYYETHAMNIFRGNKGPTGWIGIENEGTALNMNESWGEVFVIPYSYTAMSV
jgi:pectate lyase